MRQREFTGHIVGGLSRGDLHREKWVAWTPNKAEEYRSPRPRQEPVPGVTRARVEPDVSIEVIVNSLGPPAGLRLLRSTHAFGLNSKSASCSARQSDIVRLKVKAECHGIELTARPYRNLSKCPAFPLLQPPSDSSTHPISRIRVNLCHLRRPERAEGWIRSSDSLVSFL